MPHILRSQNNGISTDEITMLTRLNNLPLSSEFYDTIHTNLTLLHHYTQLVETMPVFEYTP